MFYEEIRTKQDLSYISICSLSILYNSKFVLMATSLGTNAVVVTRVHCNRILRHVHQNCLVNCNTYFPEKKMFSFNSEKIFVSSEIGIKSNSHLELC